MKNENISNALQELIIRLQDAEKGYKELSKATSNTALQKWLDRYANERHKMHQVLEGHMLARGGSPEVKTSILGDLHRVFIDIKINSLDDDFGAIVNEIKRGSDHLISDYERVLSEVEMGPTLVTTLQSQKMTINIEVEELEKLRMELEPA